MNNNVAYIVCMFSSSFDLLPWVWNDTVLCTNVKLVLQSLEEQMSNIVFNLLKFLSRTEKLLKDTNWKQIEVALKATMSRSSNT